MEPHDVPGAANPESSDDQLPSGDRMRLLRATERTAACQFGLVSRQRAVAAGISLRMLRRRRDAGELAEVLPGVFRFASAPRTFRQRAMATALWSAPDGLVSHLSAGSLWKSEGLAHGGPIHVTVPEGRRLRHNDVVVHTGQDLIAADRSMCGPIPVTAPLRTVLDLAGGLDALALEVAIEDGLRRGLFTRGQLRWRVGGRSGRGVTGSSAVSQMLARRDLGTTDSGWEVRVAAMLVAGGLPEPERQLAVSTALGTRHVDLGYSGPPIVAFEYDSDRWHSGVRQRHADAARRNALRVAGVRVVEVTSTIAQDPEVLVSLAREALAAQAS